MSRGTLPAAAVPVGAVVLVEREEGGARSPVVVSRVHNSEPASGRLRWETNGGDVAIGAATPVEIVGLP